MNKQSQNYGSLLYQPLGPAKTLQDLYIAIRADAGLDPAQKGQLVNQIKGLTGWANPSTPLSALMLKGLGGTIGWLISKYFGMGAVGQLVSVASGYGLGSVLNKQLNRPKNPYPGWRLL